MDNIYCTFMYKVSYTHYTQSELNSNIQNKTIYVKTKLKKNIYKILYSIKKQTNNSIT
jgi:hypothetical protein